MFTPPPISFLMQPPNGSTGFQLPTTGGMQQPSLAGAFDPQAFMQLMQQQQQQQWAQSQAALANPPTGYPQQQVFNGNFWGSLPSIMKFLWSPLTRGR